MEEFENGKVLVLTTNYPTSGGGISLMYVHVRNMAYVNRGIELEVLNLSAKAVDVVDGIRVITLQEYINGKDNYSILVLHAANIRQHYRFLRAYGDRFERFVFFFHGHEVLRINSVYAKDYPYVRKNWVRLLMQDIYDTFKLRTWRGFFIKNARKIEYIFVSKWMQDEFLKWTKTPAHILEGRTHIIYNSVHRVFEENHWDRGAPKQYDFITIRGNWDGAKYAVDIVNRLAKANPKMSFLLVGKGQYFNYYEKAENLELLEKHLLPAEMLHYMNISRCALMPTRTDAQGLMMCEMASYGIPTITSSLPVCYEVFESFNNVAYIDNNDITDRLESLISPITSMFPNERNDKFFQSNTVDNEVLLLKSILETG